MNNWQTILSQSITSADQLTALFPVDTQALAPVIRRYPMRINPYYLRLIREAGLPLYRQAVPDAAELENDEGLEDPLGEEALSPVPGLVHKYPDRALLLVCAECAMYCRFCTRKRKVGQRSMYLDERSFTAALEYLSKTPQIREVLLSGGDPLLLADERLDSILDRLRRIPSIEIIRIGSRVPCTLPMRVTPELVTVLKKFHPLFINTHFNHPAEITREASAACALLADAGIPLGCQTVLMKGVNDDPEILRVLFRKLLSIRVKPYYLFQPDLTRGTAHFRVPLGLGLDIHQRLSGHLSGMALPVYALDLPGGGGKVRLCQDSLIGQDGGSLCFRNYLGQEYRYPAC